MTRHRRIASAFLRVWFCLGILAAVLFGGAAAAVESCETPAQFIDDFEATHAEYGEVSVAFNGPNAGKAPGRFESSDLQRYDYVVQMRITYHGADGIPVGLSIWMRYYADKAGELCSVRSTSEYISMW